MLLEPACRAAGAPSGAAPEQQFLFTATMLSMLNSRWCMDDRLAWAYISLMRVLRNAGGGPEGSSRVASEPGPPHHRHCRYNNILGIIHKVVIALHFIDPTSSILEVAVGVNWHPS